MSPAELPLKDIHLPALPSWWPPAPGWWLLVAGVLLIAIAFAGVLRHRRRMHVRRSALAALERIAQRHAATRDAHALAADISVLLRQLVLSTVPRARAAGLSGGAWLDLLDSLAPRAPFDATMRRVLLEAPYRSDVSLDGGALVAACRRWMRSCGIAAKAAPTATPSAVPTAVHTDAPTAVPSAPARGEAR